MKLVPKLTAALMAGTFVVVAANGYSRVRREIALLESDRVSDHALLGRSLGAAVSAVWRSDGRGDALRVIEGANEHGGKVRIRWVAKEALGQEAHVDAGTLAALEPGETVTRLAETATGDKRFSYTPVAIEKERVGFVELSESRDAEHETVRSIIIDTLVTTFTMMVVCGALSVVLGIWLVGRPVGALCAKARRIGEGEFSRPLELPQRDELGQLATEMNAMCVQLTEATHRVERETAARIATIEQLRHADRLMTVGKLASGIAHELGTPLNVVSARAQMIAAGETSPDEAAEYARVIRDASNRMAKIIRQLLAFARRKPAQKAPGDVVRIARDTLELLKPLAEKSRVRFNLEGDEMSAEIDGDGIQQALTNLVVNAIHAMPGGGVVDVSMAYESRPSGDEHPGHFAVIRIHDGGEGIAKEHLPHIFEPFFTTKDVGSGTGLGLSVTHGIVEDHAGWIDVESEPAKGTLFSIHLPTKEPQ